MKSFHYAVKMRRFRVAQIVTLPAIVHIREIFSRIRRFFTMTLKTGGMPFFNRHLRQVCSLGLYTLVTIVAFWRGTQSDFKFRDRRLYKRYILGHRFAMRNMRKVYAEIAWNLPRFGYEIKHKGIGF